MGHSSVAFPEISVTPADKPATRGRPSTFTQDIADRICERLADGETLRAICRDDDMPDERTVRRWALDDVEGFSPQYARAREIGYHSLFDQMLEIADTPQHGVTTKESEKGTEIRTGDMIEHRRLRVDTRKWMLAKALPKVYGDKLTAELTGKDGAPLNEPIDKVELARNIAFIFNEAMAETERRQEAAKSGRPTE
jgi:hypothetical protein